jgi:NADH-quinone oxidoreductase subunit G
VRDDETGKLRPASWSEALDRAARGLSMARDEGGVGVLPGGRLTVEDAYAWAKFARVALATNDVDARVRPGSDEELDFLASAVAGRYLQTTYAQLEAAPAVLLVGFEPEEESPIVFLRLRKAVRRHAQQVVTVASHLSRGSQKLSARLVQAVPGQEAAALAGLHADEALRKPGAVVLVGERLASAPGAYAAVVALTQATGAKLAWVPRRAGERGAVDAGALPTLLPGGRRVADDAARAAVEAVWGPLPTEPGRDLDGILTAVKAKQLKGLLVGGVDPADAPDPTLVLDALEAAEFVVSLELRRSPVTDRADVVLPVAAVVEKAGTFLDWEGRARPFEAVLTGSGSLPDLRVLHVLADEMDRPLGTPDVPTTRAEVSALGAAPTALPVAAPAPAEQPEGEVVQAEPGVVLSTWHLLLDDGSLQDGEPHLAGTAKPAVAVLNAVTASAHGLVEGEPVTVSTDRGSLTLPLEVADLPDGVVWVPTRCAAAHVRTDLVAAHGSTVRLAKGVAQ